MQEVSMKYLRTVHTPAGDLHFVVEPFKDGVDEGIKVSRLDSSAAPTVILRPDPTRAEAGARLARRMTELLARREATTSHQALGLAMHDDPIAARVYREQ
jgi:hypothetical protein